jgi:hypothetical protein
MKAFGRLLLVLVLSGNLALLTALSLHVVRGPSGKVAFIAKSQLTLMDTYVDTRAWSADDLRTRPSLVTRIVQSGHGELIAHAANSTADALQQQPDRDIGPALAVPTGLLSSGATSQPSGNEHPKTIFDQN